MAMFTANATIEGVKVSASADVNIGETLEEAIAEYGEPCVWDLYKRGATLAVQQRIGSMMRNGTDPKEVSKGMADFRLDQRATRAKKSVEDKVTDLFEGLDNAQIAAVLSNLGLAK